MPEGNPKAGVWNPNALLVDDLRAGRLFILIHTTGAPTGELRGDILPATPTEAGTWGRIKSLYRE